MEMERKDSSSEPSNDEERVSSNVEVDSNGFEVASLF